MNKLFPRFTAGGRGPSYSSVTCPGSLGEAELSLGGAGIPALRLGPKFTAGAQLSCKPGRCHGASGPPGPGQGTAAASPSHGREFAAAAALPRLRSEKARGPGGKAPPDGRGECRVPRAWEN